MSDAILFGDEECQRLSEELLPRIIPSNWNRVKGSIAGAYIRHDGLRVIFSASRERDNRVWIHVSTSRPETMPSWSDLREVKDVFIGRTRKAIQVLPSEEEYVNTSPRVLHLWSCIDEDVIPDFRRHGQI